MHPLLIVLTVLGGLLLLLLLLLLLGHARVRIRCPGKALRVFGVGAHGGAEPRGAQDPSGREFPFPHPREG